MAYCLCCMNLWLLLLLRMLMPERSSPAGSSKATVRHRTVEGPVLECRLQQSRTQGMSATAGPASPEQESLSTAKSGDS